MENNTFKYLNTYKKYYNRNWSSKITNLEYKLERKYQKITNQTSSEEIFDDSKWFLIYFLRGVGLVDSNICWVVAVARVGEGTALELIDGDCTRTTGPPAEAARLRLRDSPVN